MLLVDDEEITKLNCKYRGTDRPTDVLAFYTDEELPNAECGPATGSGWNAECLKGQVLGDVVISVETAMRQAEERSKPLDDEMDLLLVHGILHLLGYTDDTKDSAGKMQKRAAEVIGQEAAR